MSATVTLSGGLQKFLDKDIDALIQPVIQNCCLAIERDAKMNCPVDTGNLRASISTSVGTLQGEVGTNVEYAAFVEYGTKFQAAKPYLIPAFNNNSAKLIDNLAKVIVE